MKAFSIVLFGLQSYAKTATCVLKEKSNGFADQVPQRLFVSDLSKSMIKYNFKLPSSKKGEKKYCEVPHNGIGSALDEKFVDWFKYGYGPHELDECKDAYAEVPKIRKNKPWRLALLSENDGGATAIYSCDKRPNFLDEH
jgi:hypothetical protein